jgi:hypothetical protein
MAHLIAAEEAMRLRAATDIGELADYAAYRPARRPGTMASLMSALAVLTARSVRVVFISFPPHALFGLP